MQVVLQRVLTMNATEMISPAMKQTEPALCTDRLQYRMYTRFTDLADLKEAWNDLASRVGDVLCTFDWCEVWWKHFGQGRRLEIHTLQDDGRLVAVLPLFRETIAPGGLWLRTVRVLGCDYTIETASMAIEPLYAEPFTRLLLKELTAGGAWDILQIGPLRPYQHAVFDMATASADDSNVQTVLLSRQDSWCTLFDLPQSYEQHLQNLPGDERRNILRRHRKLRQTSRVTITQPVAPGDVDAAMNDLVYWHQALWTSKGELGQFGRMPAIEQFHKQMARRFAQNRQLALITLNIDGQVLGADYGCFFGSRLHGLFRGYCRDEQWRSHGLGIELHNYMVQMAIDRNASQIDAGRGVFPYKLRIGGKLHPQASLVVVRKGWSTRIRFAGALRAAYAIHLIYSRLWIDMLAPRLHMKPKARHFHVRYSVLAQLFRRMRRGLTGGPTLLELASAPLPAARKKDLHT